MDRNGEEVYFFYDGPDCKNVVGEVHFIDMRPEKEDFARALRITTRGKVSLRQGREIYGYFGGSAGRAYDLYIRLREREMNAIITGGRMLAYLSRRHHKNLNK